MFISYCLVDDVDTSAAAAESPSYNPDSFNFTKNVVDYWASPGGDDAVAMVWNLPGEKGPDSVQSLHFSHSHGGHDKSRAVCDIRESKREVSSC